MTHPLSNGVAEGPLCCQGTRFIVSQPQPLPPKFQLQCGLNLGTGIFGGPLETIALTEPPYSAGIALRFGLNVENFEISILRSTRKSETV